MGTANKLVTTMANPLQLENERLHQQKIEDAHTLYICLQSGTCTPGSGGSGGDAAVYKRLEALEKENKELRKITDELRALILTVQSSVGGAPAKPAAAAPAAKPAAKPAAANDDDDDDDFDMFGSDSDDEEAQKLKEKRLAEYAEKKPKKPQVIAKSNVILDVKPWDDETDMKQVEANVRTIEMEGLLWGSSTLVEVGYGIKKLRITTVVVDSLVSIDDLSERIQDENEDLVQSVDIAAFNKI